jgi:hypothetical protein
MEKVFSTERMRKYFENYPADEAKAIRHYQLNISVSESLYPILCLFEVSLRNSLNRELCGKYGTADWYLALSTQPGLKALNNEVTLAKRHITKRGETITASKVVAELTLGFWVRILNAEYERILWKDLRRAFPYMAKSERKRHNVSAPINKIRDFRNRIFHHEPVLWNIEKVEQIHSDIYKVCGWISKDLPEFIKYIDRFPDTIAMAKNELQA